MGKSLGPVVLSEAAGAAPLPDPCPLRRRERGVGARPRRGGRRREYDRGARDSFRLRHGDRRVLVRAENRPSRRSRRSTHVQTGPKPTLSLRFGQKVQKVLRASPLTRSMVGPRVARGIFGWAGGPLQSTRPLNGAFWAPGHHGYPRADVLINFQASRAMG